MKTISVIVLALAVPTVLPISGGRGADTSWSGQGLGNSITLYGDHQYTRVDPPAGSGSSGSGGVQAAYSEPGSGQEPLVCVPDDPKNPNHLFCYYRHPSEPEPAPAVVPVVVSARDVASLMVDGSGITRQPPGTTARVDMDLIAYTDPSTRTLSTTVAGVAVEVEATPTSYHWDWGDATTTTTTSPGAPWPHQTVTHRYHHPQTGVHLTLTTTWTARYRPQDGTWHDVQGTVTTTQQSDTFNLVDTTTHLTDHAEHKQGH